MIKVALIPPLGWEKYMSFGRGAQMALAINGPMNSPNYLQAIKGARLRGDYIIVDNGAAEGVQCSDAYLKHCAANILASEIVLPDKIGDRVATRLKIQNYFKNHITDNVNYMAVAQGKDLVDIQRSIELYVEDDRINTVGLPRDLLRNLNNKSVRIDLANWIADTFLIRFEIHFLGASQMWPEEVKYVAKYASHVRSIDTSMPFNYGIRGLRLRNKDEQKLMPSKWRHIDYLKGTLPFNNTGIVESNIQTFKMWAEGV